MSIQILSSSVARKIAAGEVIDRPFSVVRELVDNSIDAGAKKIEIRLEDGGKKSIIVTDNGSGMPAEDLHLCTLSHATSKICHEDDLLSVRTLGFRGEALSSIAAVSRLTIRSRTQNGTGYCLKENSKEDVLPCACPYGTTVEVRDIFYNLPARRHFIKTANAETGLVKRIILDKAAAFPEIEFQLYTNGNINLHTPPSEKKERIQLLYPKTAPNSLWFSAIGSGQGFDIELFAVRPDIYRRDRRYLQVFVNNRRVQEYSLQQAIEYAYSTYIPGGAYPIAFAFVHIEPDLIDFNIHPAKKEVRFRNREGLHHRLVKITESSLHAYALSRRNTAQNSYVPSYDLDFPTEPRKHTFSESTSQNQTSFYDSAQSIYPDTKLHTSETPLMAEIQPNSGMYRYLGQLFKVFLLVEENDTLFIIDMHAGHERLRFDILKQQEKSQALMIPIAFSVEDAQAEYLQQHMEELREMGITIHHVQNSSWELRTVPAVFEGDPQKLLPFLCGKRGHANQLAVFLFATIACRGAIKEGDDITPDQAHAIIQGVFQLKDARCPHGRPIWLEFTREKLYKMVGREPGAYNEDKIFSTDARRT